MHKSTKRDKDRRVKRVAAHPAASQLQQSADNELAAEILRGAQAIAAFIGTDIRKCFYGLEKGYIPGFKEGGVWISTKTRLRNHYNNAAFKL